MKRREQALLLLRKAGQDEALLDQVLRSSEVSDEIIGFHCQQAVEKILKALLSEAGVRFRKTHDIGMLMTLSADAGLPLPAEFSNLDRLTPFGAIYRYEDYEEAISLDTKQVRRLVQELRAWVDSKLQEIHSSSSIDFACNPVGSNSG